MLKIIRNWQLQDYLRNSQGWRGFGIPVNPTHRIQQFGGAYSENNNTIVYFIARQLDFFSNSVIYNYDISTSLIKYSDGQYLIDETQLLGGTMPEGFYYLEFNDGFQTYYSELFAVIEFEELALFSSGIINWSSSQTFASLNVDKSNLIILKQFSDENYVQFAV
jgi:hypothetical protein